MARTLHATLGLAAAPSLALLAALTCTGVGCTPSGKPEEDKTAVEKVNDGAIKAEKAVGSAVGSATKATGEAIKAGGEKLEHAAADSVKRNVGETAGKAVEGIGKGMEKAGSSVATGGEKLKDASTPAEPVAPVVEPVAPPVEAPKPTPEPAPAPVPSTDAPRS